MIQAFGGEMPHEGSEEQIADQFWQSTVWVAIDHGDLIPESLVPDYVIRIIYVSKIPVIDDGWVTHSHVRRWLEIYRDIVLKSL
jgi:hypothetical protein